MRVLIAAKHPPGGALKFGGVQSWAETIASELRRRGNEVVFWGPEWDLPTGRVFDLGLFAHVKHTAPAMGFCAEVLTVAHGIVPDERPARGLIAYTSEEVRNHWRGTGPVVRQPIDLSFWCPGQHESDEVVFYSYRAPAFASAATAARRLGLRYRHLRDVDAAQARHALQGAAVVLASGRAALEAMACGAPTVIADHRAPYQGALMDTDIGRQMAHNYSGRGGREPTVDTLVSAIETAANQRAHVEAYHDARRIVQELLPCC